MRLFKNGRRKAAIGISAMGAAVAMLVTGGMSYQLVTSTDAALTDTLTFGGIFAPKPKDVKPVGQWSYSLVSLDVEPMTKGQWGDSLDSVTPQPYEHELRRDFSEQAQSRSVSGGACAWGGAGESCNGTPQAEAASDATASGNILRTSWYEGSGANAYFRPGSSQLSTGVRCSANGENSDLFAAAPSGVVEYGNPRYAFNYGFKAFDVGALESGSSVRHQVAWNTDTNTEVKMTKSSGTDPDEHRAWSEVIVEVRGEHDGANSGWQTYTFRSECGISFNDGSGSKGPRTSNLSGDTNRFANLLRSFVPWLDDDAEKDEISASESEESSVRKSDEEDATSTSEKSSSTSRDADDKDAAASEKKSSEKSSESKTSEKTSDKTSEKSSDKATSGTRDDESESKEADTPRTSEPKPEATSKTDAPKSTTTPAPEPEATPTEDATTETAAPEPLPTTAPGSPRSAGFSDASTLTLNGTDYHVLATRELGAGDVQTLADVEAAAIAAANDHEFTGTTSGASWSYFSGTGMDVIEVLLADGSVAQLRLASHGAALPQPDVAAPTQDDEEQ